MERKRDDAKAELELARGMNVLLVLLLPTAGKSAFPHIKVHHFNLHFITSKLLLTMKKKSIYWAKLNEFLKSWKISLLKS